MPKVYRLIQYKQLQAKNFGDLADAATRKAELEKDVWRLLNLVIELTEARTILEADIAGRLEADIRENCARYLVPTEPICDSYSMPRVPADAVPIPRGRVDGKVIKFAPKTSGIYFIWNQGKVVYVGCSVQMSDRITCCHNQIIKDDDCVSWLERPIDTLLTDECFYIWLLKPDRNGEVARYDWIAKAKQTSKQTWLAKRMAKAAVRVAQS